MSPPSTSHRLRVAVLLKTNTGGRWILPQVDELRGRGHDVVVILPAGDGRLTGELRRRGVRVAESPFDFRVGPGLPAGLLGLRRLIRRLAPDVLHYHLLASAFAARAATVGLPLRRVHMVAGPAYLESRVIRLVERLLWRLDDAIVCGCRHASNRYGALGCPPHRRPVATYGVNTERFRPDWAAAPHPGDAPPGGPDGHPALADRGGPGGPAHAEARAKARAELGVADDVFLAVMVAYVYPPKRLVNRGRGIKGHDVLLPAWRRFRAAHPKAHLLIIGDGWGDAGETYRRRLLDRFGVAGDPGVTWLTGVDDVRPWYAAADVSVSPSLGESHGAAVEAGAMAVPSIVSDAGGLPETVDEHSGWIVPADDVQALADALRLAYRDFAAGRLPARGRAARSLMVRRFDNRRSAADVADVLESVAATGGR